MMLTPAMQGVILAIAKARQTFDTEGPEAGLIKVFSPHLVIVFFITETQRSVTQQSGYKHNKHS